MSEPRELVTLERATKMLAECRTIDEAKKIRDVAEGARVYAAKARLGRDAVQHAMEIKLRAERRCGELLIDMARKGERRTTTTARSSNTPLLDDLGVTKNESSRWQKLARVDDFAAYVERATRGEGDKHAPLMSSDSAEWYTPSEIVERVRAVLGGIDLDPCSSEAAQDVVQATTFYTERDDGLAQAWRGAVYMNPPYGNEIAAWVTKLCDSYATGDVTAAVALLPARVDTQWWEMVSVYPVCFVRGRLKFSGHENSAPFPSAIVYLGRAKQRFYKTFGTIGFMYAPV